MPLRVKGYRFGQKGRFDHVVILMRCDRFDQMGMAWVELDCNGTIGLLFWSNGTVFQCNGTA